MSISCAKEEFESFQVIIAPTSEYSSVAVTMKMFPKLGPSATLEVGNATFSNVSAWGQGSYSGNFFVFNNSESTFSMIYLRIM